MAPPPARYLRPPAGPADGLHAFFGGIGFIVGTPSVWGYALVPAAIALVLLIGLCGLGLWGVWHGLDAYLGELSGFWATTGAWLLKGILTLLSPLLAILLALLLAQPFSGFALEGIVRAQERALGQWPSPKPSPLESLVRTASVTLFALGLGVPVLALLFLIGFLFPPALIVTVPLKFVVSGWMLAWDFFDYPLGLRGLGLGRRLAWVGRRFGAFTAFGVAWALLIFMPGVVLVLLPMGVAGATRLVVEEETAEPEILDALPAHHGRAQRREYRA
jgi:CysZ protein